MPIQSKYVDIFFVSKISFILNKSEWRFFDISFVLVWPYVTFIERAITFKHIRRKLYPNKKAQYYKNDISKERHKTRKERCRKIIRNRHIELLWYRLSHIKEWYNKNWDLERIIYTSIIELTEMNELLKERQQE